MPKKVTEKDYLKKCKPLLHEGYQVLSPYIGSSKKMIYKCPNGHTFERIAKDFLRYKSCPYCTGKHQYTTEEFNKKVLEVSDNEYSIIEPYESIHTKVKFKHHTCSYTFKMTPNNFLNGERCPYCSKRSKYKPLQMIQDTTYKQELQDFIKSFYTKKIIINYKGLDIYLPESKLAICFNSLYKHSEEASNGKCNKWYHYNKTKECEDKGIRLLHIFEDDWENHNKQIKSKIKYILHYSSDLPKVRASKCYIKEIPHQVKDKFLNTHHIQGHDGGTSVNLGLFNKETKKLMAVMTFTKLNNKSSKENDYNLSRFASHNKYIINGAFSKLLKYFLENYITDDIYTFADRTWSVGNLYDTNNFEVVDYVTPDYSYYNKTEHNLGRQHKFNFRKANIKRRFPEIYDDSKTEKQMMQEAGYVRVWNCGLIKYRLKK
jgi:hypothetical protein